MRKQRSEAWKLGQKLARNRTYRNQSVALLGTNTEAIIAKNAEWDEQDAEVVHQLAELASSGDVEAQKILLRSGLEIPE